MPNWSSSRAPRCHRCRCGRLELKIARPQATMKSKPCPWDPTLGRIMCSGASAKVKSTGTSLPLVPVWGIAHILPLPAASEWRGATLSAALSRDCRISKRILDKPLMGTRNGKTCHATGAWPLRKLSFHPLQQRPRFTQQRSNPLAFDDRALGEQPVPARVSVRAGSTSPLLGATAVSSSSTPGTCGA